MRPAWLSLVSLGILSFLPSSAASPDVTVYTGQATTTSTSSAAGSTYTGLPAYDTTVLTPPSAPQPPTTSYSLSLPDSTQDLGNYSLSITQKGNFLGFSIELSVADNVLGTSGTQLKVPFLNYLANIRDRAGAGPIIRVGGNSQEGSTLFTSGLDDGDSVEKIKTSDDVVRLRTSPT